MENRISNLALQQLCIKNNWFTYGSIQQYEKLFYANDMKAPLEEIVTIIWICSDDVCRRDIKFALEEAGFTDESETNTSDDFEPITHFFQD